MSRSGNRDELFENILRLMRAEAVSDQPDRGELAIVREFLENLAGRTIRPAEAARLLGVSQPAVQRWLEKGEIAAVTTPGGRREIPLGEVIDLLADVERVRAETGSSRPLSIVVRERREAAEAIDLDELLPRRRQRAHRTAELQSLAYHRLVASRLDDGIVDDARRRLARWREEGRVDPRWIDAWEQILAGPIAEVARAIGADTPSARELRQTSPFAGALSEHERRHLSDAVERRVHG